MVEVAMVEVAWKSVVDVNRYRVDSITGQSDGSENDSSTCNLVNEQRGDGFQLPFFTCDEVLKS